MPNKAFSLTITSKGKNPIQFIQDIQAQFYPELQARLVELADETVEEIREIIRSSKKTPVVGDLLERTIKRELLNTTGGVTIGIGNIFELNRDASYWEIVNDGANYVTTDTHVVPTNRFMNVGSGFVTFKQGSRHIIEGIDYIGISTRHLKQKLETEIKDWIYKEISRLAKG